jgi:hypothetical protein
MNPVVAVLQELQSVFSEFNCKIRGVGSREFHRWFKGEMEPTGESAQKVAFSMWDDLDLKNNSDAREKVFRKIESVIPNAPCHSWREDESFDRSAFGDWFFKLAVAGRGSGPNERFTLEAVVEVWSPERQAFLSVHDSNANPLCWESRVRVKVTCERSAYLCLIWIDSCGKATPLYPWQPGSWSEIVACKKETEVTLPKGNPGYWSLETPEGLETLVVASSNEELTADRLKSLERSWGGLKAQFPVDALIVGPPFEWLGQPESLRLNLNPGNKDPVLLRHQTVAQRLGLRFPYLKILSFKNRGKRQRSK